MNQVAVALAKHFEGYSREPYRCPAGELTVGYGHVFKLNEPVKPLSRDEAEIILAQDLLIAEKQTFKYCPVLLTESEGQQGAIIDFVFNLGAGRLRYSTLRRRINQRDWPEVVHELNRWVRGGGRVLQGLVARRKAESLHFTQ